MKNQLNKALMVKDLKQNSIKKNIFNITLTEKNAFGPIDDDLLSKYSCLFSRYNCCSIFYLLHQK